MTVKTLAAIAFAGGILTSATAAHAQDSDRIGRVIHKAMDEGEPIVTPADHAMIRAKCGYTAEQAERDNTNFNDGALKCSNGRVVKDAETVAMSRRIAARAKAKVDEVMSRPEVRAAISGEAAARANEAVRRVQAQLAHLNARKR